MIAAALALFGASLVVAARSNGLFGRDGITPRLIGASMLWVVAALSFWLVVRQSGFDLERVGIWKFGLRQVGIGFLFGVLGLLSFPTYILIARQLSVQPPSTDTMQIISSAPVAQRLFLLVTAAGAEETIFRAVAIGGLMASGLPHLAAVAIPLFVFVILHRSSWGVAHLSFVTVAGGLMTGAFVLGGIWAAILAHLIVDAPMMLAGTKMAKRDRRDNRQINERN